MIHAQAMSPVDAQATRRRGSRLDHIVERANAHGVGVRTVYNEDGSDPIAHRTRQAIRRLEQFLLFLNHRNELGPSAWQQ
eukprot:3116031-Prymnesium_polylepis.3